MDSKQTFFGRDDYEAIYQASARIKGASGLVDVVSETAIDDDIQMLLAIRAMLEHEAEALSRIADNAGRGAGETSIIMEDFDKLTLAIEKLRGAVDLIFLVSEYFDKSSQIPLQSLASFLDDELDELSSTAAGWKVA